MIIFGTHSTKYVHTRAYTHTGTSMQTHSLSIKVISWQMKQQEEKDKQEETDLDGDECVGEGKGG